MELPTPPGTSHRDEKENRHLVTRVAWNDKHEIHTLTADLTRRQLTQVNTPVRSILKKTLHKVLSFAAEDAPRDSTPEPSDPLTDLHYLANPVEKIISTDAELRDLVESYSILAARLRACVSGNTDADASWPLFQPLRKHRDALVKAMYRDLGRALESPPSNEPEEVAAKALPSPERSPKKKGMSAEAVKYARDLCTTCHAVLKLLSTVFTLPAIFGIFEESHLCDLLTGVLAIPLAPELPTPNARKTCALAIWLLQYQRLPSEVLLPARDRIAYALRRGIEGELGKEGKKGSASDGLKAIHDLSICYPSVFIPAFTDLLPSVFAQLLAPTLPLRTQACHALGGYAYGLSLLPSSAVHSLAANHTASFLTKAPLGTPSKKPSSPTKDPAIIRTLRTTLAATDPRYVAQGPVWALSLLGYFIIMLGPQTFLDDRMSKCIIALSSLATRHPKSSVRSLACLIWRCMTWAYFQPLPKRLRVVEDRSDESQQEAQESEDEGDQEYSPEELEYFRQRMVIGWKIVSSVMEMGAGVSTIAALLGPPTVGSDGDKPLRRALALLDDMSKKGGFTCREALLTVSQLVSRYRLASSQDQDADAFDGEEDFEWSLSKLLPLHLFSSSPGLLTADYGSLAPVVKGLVAECPHVEEVRVLGLEEITTPWVFDCLIQVWMDGLSTLKIQWGDEFPAEIINVWSCLLNAKVTASQDDEVDMNEFAHYVVDILATILKDRKLDFSSKQEDDDRLLALTSPAKRARATAAKALPVYRWKPALKLLFVRQLWLIATTVLPASSLPEPAAALLTLIDVCEAVLIVDVNVADDVRAQWASLCAEIAYHCTEHELQAFWGLKRSRTVVRRKPREWNCAVRSFVWSHFVEKWREEPKGWESSAALLCVPFLEPNAWDVTHEDLDEWQAFLQSTMDRALDYGVDAISVLDQVAAVMVEQHSLALPSSSTHVLDLLLSKLDMADARSLPFALCDLVNATLLNNYPPNEHSKTPSLWLLRSVNRAIDACPYELTEQLLETIQDGLCQWISDEHEIIDEDEYSLDVLPVYQTALAGLMSLTAQASTLERLSLLLDSAFCGREDKPDGAVQAFLDFWGSAYTSMEPVDGWPAKIAHCLEKTGIRHITSLDAERSPENTDEVDSTEDDEVESQLLVSEVDDNLVSPVIPSPTSLARAFILPTLRSPSPRKTNILEPPSTPTAPLRILSQPRPQSTVSPAKPLAPLLFEHSPSHASSASPSRPPSTPKRRTPGTARTRKGDEKENASPLRVFASVTERLATRSPGSTLPVLGKRRFDSDDETIGQEVYKRPHKDVTHIFGDTLQNAHAMHSIHVNMALVSPQPSSSATTPPLTPPKVFSKAAQPEQTAAASAPLPSWLRNRRGVFLEAVEVPTLRSLRARSISLGAKPSSSARTLAPTRSLPLSTTDAPKSPSDIPVPRPMRSVVGLRRNSSASPRERSEGSVLPHQPSSERQLKTPAKKSNLAVGKRKRDLAENDDSHYSLTSSLSSPIRRLKEMEAMNSDDSMALATPSLVTASTTTLSSDDDPHRFVGQVTPHRVVSPAIRRVRVEEFSSEPGSDDSVMSASPTTERVARMKRSANDSPQKLPFRPTSLSF